MYRSGVGWVSFDVLRVSFVLYLLAGQHGWGVLWCWFLFYLFFLSHTLLLLFSRLFPSYIFTLPSVISDLFDPVFSLVVRGFGYLHLSNLLHETKNFTNEDMECRRR